MDKCIQYATDGKTPFSAKQVLSTATYALQQTVKNAVERQGHLSWDNFMKGRIAFEWCWAQTQYYNDMPNHSTLDSTAWSTKLIKAIWTIFVDIWNACNAHLHTGM
eukprot:13168540-Ditylum_brightwellii.AAC.1